MLIGAFVLAALGAVIDVSDPEDAYDHPTETALRARRLAAVLQPIRAKSGGVYRVYFEGFCSKLNGTDLVEIPEYVLEQPDPSLSGVAAVRSVFRNQPGVEVSDRGDGVVRIVIGHPNLAILDTWIDGGQVDDRIRFDSSMVLQIIEHRPEIHDAAERLGVRDILWQAVMWGGMVGAHAPGDPAFPPVVTGLSFDQALDLHARSFNEILGFGTCDPPAVYWLDVFRWTPPKKPPPAEQAPN